jgi:hypothetical protein
MGEKMKFAGMRGESRPETVPVRVILARDGLDFEWQQSGRVIFNNLLNCSARP